MTPSSDNPHLPSVCGRPGANFRRHQKNTLLRIIKNSETPLEWFSLSGPRWVKRNSFVHKLLQKDVVVVVRASVVPSKFVLGFNDPLPDIENGPYNVAYFPHLTMEHEAASSATWENTCDEFGYWIDAVRREAVPDEWEELRKRQQIEDAQWEIVSGYDTPFTNDEVHRIGQSLDAVTDEIKQKRLLSPEELKALTAGLKAMKDAAPAANRISWTNKLFEWWLKWAIESAMKSDVAHQVLAVLSDKLSWAVHTISAAGTRIVGLLKP